jgi:hypothetical protein
VYHSEVGKRVKKDVVSANVDEFRHVRVVNSRQLLNAPLVPFDWRPLDHFSARKNHCLVVSSIEFSMSQYVHLGPREDVGWKVSSHGVTISALKLDLRP